MKSNKSAPITSHQLAKPICYQENDQESSVSTNQKSQTLSSSSDEAKIGQWRKSALHYLEMAAPFRSLDDFIVGGSRWGFFRKIFKKNGRSMHLQALWNVWKQCDVQVVWLKNVFWLWLSDWPSESFKCCFHQVRPARVQQPREVVQQDCEQPALLPDQLLPLCHPHLPGPWLPPPEQDDPWHHHLGSW